MMTFQRPSGAYTGAEGLENRTKFQNDAAAEPKIAISSSAMDGEFNYILDALNSINAARGTTESIEARIGSVLNADGTLRASLVASLDDWSVHNAINLQRINGTSIRIDGNETARYPVGRRVRLLVNGSAYYADVAGTEFTTFTTVHFINLVSNAGVEATLQTHPTQIAHAPTLTGVTGNATRVQELLQIGTEFRFIAHNNTLLLQHNTGEINTPVWSAVTGFDTTGIQLNNNSIALNKLARAGETGQILMSNGTGADASFQTFNGVPTGAVQAYAGNTAPTGWVLCGGQAISRVDFAPLFSIIGTTYGAGDMATTFNVPDLRGRSVFGRDTGANRLTTDGAGFDGSQLGAAGGSENLAQHNHTLTDPGHSHTFNAQDQTAGGGGGYNLADVNENAGSNLTGFNGQAINTSSTGITIDDAGTGTAGNIPPALVMNYIIRT